MALERGPARLGRASRVWRPALGGRPGRRRAQLQPLQPPAARRDAASRQAAGVGAAGAGAAGVGAAGVGGVSREALVANGWRSASTSAPAPAPAPASGASACAGTRRLHEHRGGGGRQRKTVTFALTCHRTNIWAMLVQRPVVLEDHDDQDPLFEAGEFLIGKVRRHESMNNIDALFEGLKGSMESIWKASAAEDKEGNLDDTRPSGPNRGERTRVKAVTPHTQRHATRPATARPPSGGPPSRPVVGCTRWPSRDTPRLEHATHFDQPLSHRLGP